MQTSQELVKNIREKNSTATASEIGHALGISRERVRQLLKKLNLPTHHDHQTNACLVCGEPRGYNTKFCSHTCQFSYSRVNLQCPACNKSFSIRKSDWIRRVKLNKNIYCSHRCRNLNFSSPLHNKIDPLHRRMQKIGTSYGFSIFNPLLKELGWKRDGQTFSVERIGDSILISRNHDE